MCSDNPQLTQGLQMSNNGIFWYGKALLQHIGEQTWNMQCGKAKAIHGYHVGIIFTNYLRQYRG